MPLPPILDAKLQQPRSRHPTLPRSRATARLQRFLDTNGLAIVAGPPGFARRALVAGWCDRQPPASVAWVRCDAGDEPVRLFLHVVAAMRTIDPDLVPDAEEIARAGPDTVAEQGLPAILTGAGRLDRPITVVLDDVDLLPAWSRQLVVHAERDRPENANLILIVVERSLLDAIPLHGQMEPPVLGRADLVLDRDDVDTIVSALGLTATNDEVAALLAATDGWPAGVMLTAERAARDGTPLRFDVARAEIADHLHRRVCSRMGADDLGLLQDLAVAGSLAVVDAVDVTGRPDAIAALERLEQAELVEPAQGNLVRVPDMVAAHLVDDVRRADPDRVVEVQRRAANAHAAAGRVDLALDLIEGADDDEALVGLMLTRHHVWSAGSHATRIVDLADRLLRRDPRRTEVYLVKAWAETLSGRGADAEATATLVSSLPVPEPVGALVRGEVAAIRTNMARLEGRFDDALAEARAMHAAAVALPDGWRTTYRGALPDGSSVLLGVALLFADLRSEARDVLLAATTLAHLRPVALSTVHGALALNAWLADDPTARIHAAIATSHVGGRPSQGEFLGSATFALTGDGEEAERAAAWTEQSASALAAPISGVMAAAVRIVRSDDPAEVDRAVDDARAWIDRAPQPGVLPRILARAAELADLTAVEAEATASIRAAMEPLTDGERRVVLALRGDLSEREIAEHLHLSHNTVRAYRRRAYRKLGVSTRADAVTALSRIERD